MTWARMAGEGEGDVDYRPPRHLGYNTEKAEDKEEIGLQEREEALEVRQNAARSLGNAQGRTRVETQPAPLYYIRLL